MLKWKHKYLKELDGLSNENVLDEYTEMLTDVDNDAVRSDKSQWKLGIIEVELKKRLVDCGFLNAP